MKPRQFIVLVFTLVAVGLGSYVAVTSFYQPPPTLPPVDAAKLIGAVQLYTRDQHEASQPLPAALTLRDLLNGGYVTTNEARAFEGMEVSFLLNADPNRPRSVLIRVQLRDGSQMVVLANGTVEHLPR